MNTAIQIPFTTIDIDEEDTMTIYTTRHDLESALDQYNAANDMALSEESLEALTDYLSAHADYAAGLWDTGATLNIDTIDEDTFTQLVIAVDNGEL